MTPYSGAYMKIFTSCEKLGKVSRLATAAPKAHLDICNTLHLAQTFSTSPDPSVTAPQHRLPWGFPWPPPWSSSICCSKSFPLPSFLLFLYLSFFSCPFLQHLSVNYPHSLLSLNTHYVPPCPTPTPQVEKPGMVGVLLLEDLFQVL